MLLAEATGALASTGLSSTLHENKAFLGLLRSETRRGGTVAYITKLGNARNISASIANNFTGATIAQVEVHRDGEGARWDLAHASMAFHWSMPTAGLHSKRAKSPFCQESVESAQTKRNPRAQ